LGIEKSNGELHQVSEIPPGAELLASSERTGIEMFAVGEHALAIQGHPEFFDDVVVDLLEGRLASMMTVLLTPFSLSNLEMSNTLKTS